MADLETYILQMKQLNEKYYNGDGDGHQFDATAKAEFLADYNAQKLQFKIKAQELP